MPRSLAFLITLLAALGVTAFLVIRFLVIQDERGKEAVPTPRQRRLTILLAGILVVIGATIVGVMVYVFYFEP